MQVATPATVLGRFDGATFVYHGITSTFFREGKRYFVRTDGPDGKLADFEVKYTLSVFPLQQYLAEFSDGRMQALSIAWDSRPKGKGGGRWFHLYPKEAIDFRDPLHWTRLAQNWNFVCADCYSNNLRHNYDQKTDRYAISHSHTRGAPSQRYSARGGLAVCAVLVASENPCPFFMFPGNQGKTGAPAFAPALRRMLP